MIYGGVVTWRVSRDIRRLSHDTRSICALVRCLAWRAIQTVYNALNAIYTLIKYMESYKVLEVIQLRKLKRLKRELKALQQSRMQQQTLDQWI